MEGIDGIVIGIVYFGIPERRMESILVEFSCGRLVFARSQTRRE